ncbi:MAG TPA: hypothetical protein VLD65_00645 [Anaerolineales bacterium]|nr:hypothetical protein [Anaerolineales bacterium]
MLTEDYIMRMISQALAVLMTALGLKKAGKYREALQVYDQAIETLLGLNHHLVNQLEDSAILDKLTIMEKLDVERLLVLADIYLEEAEVFHLLGDTQNDQSARQRSLRLYLEVYLASEASTDQVLIQKIEALRSKIACQSLPIESRLAVQDYIDRLLSTSDDFLASNGIKRIDLQADLSALDRLDQQ